MERRRSQRTAVHYPGRILVRNELVHDCVVHNLTVLGICIELAFAADLLPDGLDFNFDNFHTVHRCRVVWREGNLIGAALEDPVPPTCSAEDTRAAKLRTRPTLT